MVNKLPFARKIAACLMSGEARSAPRTSVAALASLNARADALLISMIMDWTRISSAMFLRKAINSYPSVRINTRLMAPIVTMALTTASLVLMGAFSILSMSMTEYPTCQMQKFGADDQTCAPGGGKIDLESQAISTFQDADHDAFHHHPLDIGHGEYRRVPEPVEQIAYLQTIDFTQEQDVAVGNVAPGDQPHQVEIHAADFFAYDAVERLSQILFGGDTQIQRTERLRPFGQYREVEEVSGLHDIFMHQTRQRLRGQREPHAKKQDHHHQAP
ncbi:hypothetical protein CCP4SC76_6870002 [Gammaproteobacteria bacterium]